MNHPGVSIDSVQVDRFSTFFKSTGEAKAFTFLDPTPGLGSFPGAGHPGALDAFFFITAHQFGFWELDGTRYGGPMIATLDGRPRKGSDYLFRCMTRALEQNPDFFQPLEISKRTDPEWSAVFSDDEGRVPLPMWDAHLDIISRYAHFLKSTGFTPAACLDRANTASESLAAFAREVGEVPGYREDPMSKKLMLLAVILENRPEHFLRVTDPGRYQPIIDYHLQRSALRTGLVRVENPALREKLENRALVQREEEMVIRSAVFDCMEKIVEQSGSSVAAVDYFFFQNRTRCPEMTDPDCAHCPVQSICAREVRMFQPVFRTEDY